MADTVSIADRAFLLKTIADETRLRMLGLIVGQPQSGELLADALGLSAPTISHHMRKLVDTGMVSEERVAQSRIYSLNNQFLRSVRVEGRSDQSEQVSYDLARVMKHFFKDGLLVTVPAARKQRVIVLQYLLEQFDPHRSYPEREVNELLGSFNEDFATLRRELVDYGYLVRDKGIYQVANSLPKRSGNQQQELPANEADWLRALIQASLIQD